MNAIQTRRRFLRTGLLGAAAAGTVPAFLSATCSRLSAEAAERAQPATGKEGTVLVVIQMAGGNDGLNTVVPQGNDYYYKARPSLGLKSNLLPLNALFALNPALSGLKEIYDAGHLSIVQGVGYPNPNRSHFRSMEIWQTASDSKKVEKYGWIGRYFDHACQGCDPTIGINIGRRSPQAFASAKPVGVTLESLESYRLNAGELAGSAEFSRALNRSSESAGGDSGGSIESVAGQVSSQLTPLDYLQRVAVDAQASSEALLKVSRRAANLATYPASRLANSLKVIARLIAGGATTRVYYASLGGFDTHVNQSGAHERLLGEFGSALKSFHADLRAQGNLDRVLVMTFSEFGRRLAQNANGGTDHGAAAPMFFMNSNVKSGLVGSFPSLAPADLANGDPQFTVDFRRVYAGVLAGWLKTNPDPILGRHFDPLLVTA